MKLPIVLLIIFAAALPSMAVAACDPQYNSVKNSEHRLGQMRAQANACAQANQTYAAERGQLEVKRGEWSPLLSALHASAANRATAQSLIGELLPVLERFAAGGGWAERLEEQLTALLRAQPDLSLAQAMNDSVRRMKLSGAEAEDLVQLTVLLKIMEDSWKDWLVQSRELAADAMAQGSGFSGRLLEKLVTWNAESKAIDTQEQALIQDYEAKTAGAANRIQELQNAEAANAGQIAALNPQIAAIAGALPGLIDSLNECSERAARKFDKSPK